MPGLEVEGILDGAAFRGFEPVCSTRRVGEIPERQSAQKNSGEALQDEHPAPGAQMEPLDLEHERGERAADGERDRRANHETGHGAGTIALPKPAGQVHDYAGKEPGLCDSQQKSARIELFRRADKREERGNQSPGNENGTDPAAGAPPLHDQGAGNLQHKVTEKEDARADAIDAFGEAQFFRHGKTDKGEVGAVEVSGDIEDEDERKNAARDFAAQALALAQAIDRG